MPQLLMKPVSVSAAGMLVSRMTAKSAVLRPRSRRPQAEIISDCSLEPRSRLAEDAEVYTNVSVPDAGVPALAFA